MSMKLLDEKSIRTRIRAALEEDLHNVGDVTTNAIFQDDAVGSAVVVAKEEGFVCGQVIFRWVFEELGQIRVTQKVPEGGKVFPGERVMELYGCIRHLLAGERTALNFLQHLSGVCTATRRMVNAVGGSVAVCDTRKTIPLWRDVEKYAVRCGGGVNHRMGLDDMVMIKDTHADGAGSLVNALKLVENLRPKLKIAAEARNLQEVQAAVDAKVDLIMLDNMSMDQLRQALKMIKGDIMTEVTGGITTERARELALLGIDRVSVGSLTHSVKAMDFSMRLEGIINPTSEAPADRTPKKS